ncbi:hypothetical protein HanRHA438_Chr07g0292151 [Helianthus annuus]|nr:hypothetical protein HanRHA438_Chr07g0292151 [Helianthus annuus]
MKAEREVLCCVCCEKRTRVFVEVKKTNSLLLANCRSLVHIFSCRCLQMWFAECRPFTSSKTNST